MKPIRLALLLFGCLLCLSGYGQEWPPVTLYPALYVLTYLRAQPDSVAGPALIGSLPVVMGRFYGEVRYNYDATQTVGLYGGRAFTFGGQRWSHNLTAQLGILWGDYRGVSAQLYYQLSMARIEISSQQQYSVSRQSDRQPFYYTWSDMQWKAGRYLRAGVSVQMYRQSRENTTDGGVIVGCQLPRLTLSLYLFDLYQPGRSYAYLAIQYSVSLTHQRQPTRLTIPAPIPPLFPNP